LYRVACRRLPRRRTWDISCVQWFPACCMCESSCFRQANACCSSACGILLRWLVEAAGPEDWRLQHVTASVGCRASAGDSRGVLACVSTERVHGYMHAQCPFGVVIGCVSCGCPPTRKQQFWVCVRCCYGLWNGIGCPAVQPVSAAARGKLASWARILPSKGHGVGASVCMNASSSG
jgi:hypothetical protein